MYQYRIYTERTKALSAQIDEITKVTPAFTLIETSGYWRGIPEKSIIFEIIDDDLTFRDIPRLAQEIKRLGCQEAVLCTKQTIETSLI